MFGLILRTLGIKKLVKRFDVFYEAIIVCSGEEVN